jgi:hypothetical protein
MSLKDAFAGMAAARDETTKATADPSTSLRDNKQGVPEALRTQAPKRLSVEAPVRAPLPLAGTAKSRHPEFEPVKIYLRKATHKTARRKWEDADRGDFSDLVQHLLEKYLGS